MPNKKINALDVRTAVSTDLMLVGDPATGTAYKSTVANLPLVPYTGATGAVNLGAFGITAASLIKSGGTSSQFLKADGSVDSSTYQAALTLTTTGTSGAATLVGATLNIPQYAAGITGSGVANQLTYWNGTGSVTGSSALTYVDSTGLITLIKNQNADTALNIGNSNINTNAQSKVILTTDSNAAFVLGKYSSAFTGYKIFAASDSTIWNGRIGNTANAGDIAILNDYSSGKIKFAAGAVSTSQMTLTAAGRLLLGTTTESTFILDAAGSGRFIGVGASYASVLFVENTGSASDANKNVAIFVGARGNASNIIDNSNIGIWQKNNNIGNYANFSFYNSIGDLTAFIGVKYNAHSGNPNGDLVFGNNPLFVTTERMRLTNAGRLLIGTTTESTYLLDVNGTARVSGQLTAGSATLDGQATSGTSLGVKWFSISGSSGRYIYNSTTNTDLLAFNNGIFALQGNGVTSFAIGSFGIAATGSRNVAILGGGNGAGSDNVSIGNDVANGLTTGSNNVSIGHAALYNVTTNSDNVAVGRYAGTSTGSNANANHSQSIFIGSGTGWSSGGTALTNTTIIGTNLRTNLSNVLMLGKSDQTIMVGEGTSVGSGAIIQIDSTTKGFLPPRMTTAQINAIATPAEGLQVYNTTINHMCFYQNGAWAKISHSPM